ncbi:hypothetical protein FB107DRAFT_256282 [Schizophyllum commune]
MVKVRPHHRLPPIPPHRPQKASIHSLPVELLTRIFVLGANYDFPYHHSPFLLRPNTEYYPAPASNFQLTVSAVCSHWRSIALATPSLWSFLFFREPSHIDRAQEYIARCEKSGYITFDILIDTVQEKYHIPNVTLYKEEIERIFQLVCPHAARWRSFHLKVRDKACKLAARHYLSGCGPAPQLEILQLYHFEDYGTAQNLYDATFRPPVPIFDNNLPRLQHVSMIGVNLPWATSPYLQHPLTSFELALHPNNIRIPYDLWDKVLKAASPTLRRLTLHYSGPKSAGTNPDLVWRPPNEKILMPALEELCVIDLDPEYACLILERMTCPRVRVMHVELADQNFAPLMRLISGLHNSASSTTPNPITGLPPERMPASSEYILKGLHTFRIAALQCTRSSCMLLLLQKSANVRVLDIDFERAIVKDPENGRTVYELLKMGFGWPPELPPKGKGKEPETEELPRTLLFPNLEEFRMNATGEQLKGLIEARVHHTDIRWAVKYRPRARVTDPLLASIVENGLALPDGRVVTVSTFRYEEDEEEEEDEDDVEESASATSSGSSVVSYASISSAAERELATQLRFAQ